MADHTVYEIVRYRVDQPEEVLLETARIVVTDGGAVKVGPGGDSVAVPDIGFAIRSDPALNEIRANEITRITAREDVVDQLPFVLTAPGEADDFDEDAWSKELATHVDPLYERQIGVYRVLFVNGDRWCPWETTEGQSMLPEAWPVIRLQQEWIEVTVDTENDGITWTHRTVLGLVSDGVAGSFDEPDIEWEKEPQEVGMWRRDGTVDTDAHIIVDWLLNSPFQRSWGFSIETMVVRLFLEVAGKGRDQAGLSGDRLAAGDDPQPEAGNLETDIWWMRVNLRPQVAESVIELLSTHSERIRDVVASVREPNSPAAVVRRGALARRGYVV